MIQLFADLDPKSFWNATYGSTELVLKLAFGFLLGFGLLFALMGAPARLRRPIVVAVTILSGLFYFLLWIYPSPIARGPADAPRNALEGFSFWLADAQPVVANFSNVISAFLLGLGVFSLLRIHGRRVAKQQRDWEFSVALIVSLVLMVIFGYWDWMQRQSPAGAALLFSPSPNWGPAQYGRDLLFDGLYQQMDATMFSLIAFYILSAAYRAFRARSVEATVLLVTALIVIISLMGVLEHAWDQGVNSLAGGNPNNPLQNLQITEIAKWLKNTMQTASIRGLDFGIGIGLLTMSLRLWLGLERMDGEA